MSPRLVHLSCAILLAGACSDAGVAPSTGALRSTVNRASSVEDVTAPTLMAVSFDPSTVDISDAARTVTLSIRVQDNLSGVERGFFQLRSPSGAQSLFGMFSQLTAGSALDGTFEARIDVPRFSEGGAWRFGYLRLDDKANNTVTLFPTTLEELGMAAVLTVTGTSDVNAPTLVDVSFAPFNVGVTTAAQIVRMRISVRDELAGFQRAFFQVTSPSGAQSVFGMLTQLASGDAHDGTYQGEVSIPRFSETGAWRIAHLRLDDNVNNVVNLFAPQLAALGLDRTFSVSSVSDVTAPTLVGVSFAPSTIDVGLSDQTVTLTVHAKDEVSGFQRGFFHLTSPSGGQSIFGMFTELLSGDLHDGTYQARIVFPRFSELGQWRFGHVRLDDVANNQRLLFTPELDALGFTARVTVTSLPADATAPVITANLTGVEGTNGWYRSDVGISWTVVDGQSPITSAEGCADDIVSTDGVDHAFTCTAVSAGGSASKSVTVKRDATSPVIAFAGNAGTYGVDEVVAISCSVTDGMSGVASATCPSAAGLAYTFAVGANALNASASDHAGNSASASTTFTVQVSLASLVVLTNRLCGNAGIARALGAKLDAAAAAMARGDLDAARGLLRAYVNQVEAQTGKSISPADAAILIRLVKSL